MNTVFLSRLQLAIVGTSQVTIPLQAKAIIARRIAAEREGSTKTRYLLVETWVGASPNSVFQTSHGISR